MALFEVGKRYFHVLLGLPCTVTGYYGNQHRVDVRLDDGREFQGVPFDQVQDLPAAPPPPSPPPVAPPAPPEPPQAPPEPPAIHDSVGPMSDDAPPIEERRGGRKAPPRPRFSNENDVPDPEA